MATQNNSTTQLRFPTGLPVKGVHHTRTDDGSVLAVIFDSYKAESTTNDQTQSAEAAVLNFEVPLAPGSNGLVRVEAHGFMGTAGSHSWIHAVIWVNGQRMVPISNAGEVSENFYAALCVDVTGQSALRVSVTLLVQRDLAIPTSSAELVLDTLDFAVLPIVQLRQF
jgi:hypothetical protein